jgi:hypothetical protein
MNCQLTQITFGMLEAGMTVNAKYDPANKERVVLMDDPQTFLQYRVKNKDHKVAIIPCPE